MTSCTFEFLEHDAFSAILGKKKKRNFNPVSYTGLKILTQSSFVNFTSYSAVHDLYSQNFSRNSGDQNGGQF
jgi:hypothetical protein